MSTENIAELYLKLLREASEYLDARGVLITKRIVLFRMDDLYIQLGATRKVKREILIPKKPGKEAEGERKGQKPKTQEKKAGVEKPPRPESRAKGEQKEGRESEKRKREREFERRIVEESEPVEVPELISNERRIVILGDPGAGKTTLLRNIAFKLADAALKTPWDKPLSDHEYMTPNASSRALELNGIPVPIPIPITLRYFARSLNEGEVDSLGYYIRKFVVSDLLNITRVLARQKELMGGLTEAEKQQLENFVQNLDLMGEWLLEVAENGLAYILLDGLDEVADRETRYRLVDALLEFESSHPEHTYIATSRIVGYGLRPLPERYVHATLRPFDDKQIEAFVRKWYAALHRFETAFFGVETFKAESEAQWLINEINEKEQLKAIATNPLILTIIGLIHHQGTKLPNQRAALYREVAETFIWSWEEAKRLEALPLEKLPDPRETRAILAELALYLHEHTEDNLATKNVFKRIVMDFAKRRRKPDPEDYAERFIDLLSRRSGLLSERGQNLFGFMHLTFQEYFAALAMTSHRSRIPRYHTEYLWNARWNEVMLLGAGIQGEKSSEDAAEYIESILKVNHPMEPYLHHELLTAARCFADDVDILDYPELVDRILNELERLYFVRRKPIKPLRDKILKIWNDMARTVYRERLVRMFERRMERVGAEWDTWEGEFDFITETLLKLNKLEFKGKSDRLKEIANAIAQRLEDEYSDVRRAAIEALAKLNVSDTQIINAIVKRLEDEDWDVRMAAIEALAKLNVSDTQIINAIVKRLEDEDWDVRMAAIEALAKLNVSDTQIINAILKRLEDEYSDVRMAAIEALAKLNVSDTQIINAIVKKLEDYDPDVKETAIEALGRLNISDPKVINAIAQKLEDWDPAVRRAAIKALARLNISVPKIITSIVQRLDEDWDPFVKSTAIEALGRLNISDPKVINAIAQKLEEYWSSDVKRAAIEALANLNVSDSQIIYSIAQRLEDEYSDVRMAAIEALAKLNVSDSQIIHAIAQRLEDENGDVREAAIEALAKLNVSDSQIIHAIAQRLEHENGDVREAAIEALAKLNVSDSQIIHAIAQRLEDEDWYSDFRAVAYRALEKIYLGEGNA